MLGSKNTVTFILAALFCFCCVDAGYSWKRLPPLAYNRTDLASVAVGDVLFMTGGCDADQSGCQNNQLVGPVSIYTPGTKTVDVLPINLSIPRYRHSAVLSGSMLYVIAGRGVNDTALNETEVIDTTSRTISAGVPIPSARSDCPGFVYFGLVYIFGGYDDQYTTLDDGWIFDPSTNTWNASSLKFNTARGDFVAVAYNDRVYAIGGFDFQYLPLNTVEVFNGAEWFLLRANMFSARGDFCAGVLSSRLVVIGGESRDRMNSSIQVILNTVESYGDGDLSWRNETIHMDTDRYRMGYETLNGDVYCVGGHDDNGSATNIMEALTGAGSVLPANLWILVGMIILSMTTLLA